MEAVENISEKENVTSKQSFYVQLLANPYVMSQCKHTLLFEGNYICVTENIIYLEISDFLTDNQINKMTEKKEITKVILLLLTGDC